MQVLASRGPLPGSYAVGLKPSRRNSRQKVKYTREMRTYYRKVSRSSQQLVPPLGPLTDESVYTAMVAGVKLNGRPYAQGCTVIYLPRIRPMGNIEGVGGLDGSSTSKKVGFVNMFYVINGVVLVDITDVPVIETCRSMFIVQRAEPECLDLFQQLQTLISTAGRTLVHVDSISAKAHTAPHFTRDDWMCVIPMWVAR